MFQIMDGKLVSQSVKDRIRDRVAKLKEQGKEITLAVIIVGDDPASRVYVNNKKKACEYVGFRSLEYALPASTTQDELIALIRELNEMLPYLAVDEMELRRITESVLQKLGGMTDRQYAAFCAEWIPEI